MQKDSKKTPYFAKIPNNSLPEPLTRNHGIYIPRIISPSTAISSAYKMLKNIILFSIVINLIMVGANFGVMAAGLT